MDVINGSLEGRVLMTSVDDLVKLVLTKDHRRSWDRIDASRKSREFDFESIKLLS